MKYFWSQSSYGFFMEGDKLPDDAVEITQKDYEKLKSAASEGKTIVSVKGKPKAEKYELSGLDIQYLRRVAYSEESDHLKIEAEHDAISAGGNPDYSKWLEKVSEIKTRYPLPASS